MLQTELFNIALFTSVILENDLENDADPCNCYNCSETVDNDEILEINGDQYCVDCVIYCEYCGDPVLETSTVYTSEYGNNHSDQYCYDCIDDHTWCCADCNDHYSHNTNFIHVEDNNDDICYSCYENGDYFTCEDCHDVYSCYQLNSNQDGCFCNDCYADHNNSSDYVLPYNTNVLDHLDFMGDPKDRIYLGIELEVYIPKDSDLQDISYDVSEALDGYAILTEDGSIGDPTWESNPRYYYRPGFEIVSCPCSLDLHRENLTNFFDSDPEIDTGSTNIGLHIHVSREPLGELTVGKIVQFMNDPNNKDRLVDLAERESDQWAKFDPSLKIASVKNSHKDRYSALNIRNENTIEFRLFKSTDNLDLILARLEFVHCLASWTKFESMQTLSWDRFASYAKDNRKAYPSLYRWLEDNA